MAGLNWNKLRHAGKPREQAFEAKPDKDKGAQTNIKRLPVKHYTNAEIAQWAKALGL